MVINSTKHLDLQWSVIVSKRREAAVPYEAGAVYALAIDVGRFSIVVY